ncbi:MAG: beta-N-acetylhexosaminidase [Gammaproteobacteria bacterium]|nr:beta-N-acetylhexosaminidase [Gammaproteobacteria bacterium]
MSLGPLMIDLDGLALSFEERELLRHPLVGGVILFSRNYESREQLTALTRAIHGLRSPRLLIAVDHEGGRVQRFREEFTALPPLNHLGRHYAQKPREALAMAIDLGWLMAAELRAAEIDFSFAPILDLYSAHSRVINDRAFHPLPETVARLGQAYMRGMHAAGMAAVGKHFPGHGTVDADSHHELPIDRRGLQAIRTRDLLPFRLLISAGLEGIMPAHILFPAVDGVPVGYSKVWIDEILRAELGFMGAVFSDDLSMSGAAVMASHVERTHMALAAGCDMCLICNDRRAVARVLDHIVVAPNPLAQVRLMRMHARGTTSMPEVLAHPRYAAARFALLTLEPAPTLAFRDDTPA